jgi:hypothetical protein
MKSNLWTLMYHGIELAMLTYCSMECRNRDETQSSFGVIIRELCYIWSKNASQYNLSQSSLGESRRGFTRNTPPDYGDLLELLAGLQELWRRYSGVEHWSVFYN